MNKDLLIKGMIFLAGGAIGSVVTWKLVKTKYEKFANEEIDSMREYYYNKKAQCYYLCLCEIFKSGFHI